MEKTDEEARGFDSASGALVSSTLGSVFSVELIVAVFYTDARDRCSTNRRICKPRNRRREVIA
jgi:hypothetical protein